MIRVFGESLSAPSTTSRVAGNRPPFLPLPGIARKRHGDESAGEWRPSTGTPALLPGDVDVGGNDLRRPLGRGFIEALVTDNLHIGRPELIELIFRCGQRPGRP